LDITLFKLINGLSGKFPAVGHVMSGISNDYFLPVIVFLIFVAMWFGTRDLKRRAINQRAVLIGLIAVGLANALVAISTILYFRSRPFAVLPAEQVHLFFYHPTDSSFPSNFATLLFAAAISIFIYNRRMGTILFVIALIGAFGRVLIGVHFPLDIFGGIIYGAVATMFAYFLGRIFNPVLTFVLNLTKKLYLS
jgi:undecaprenyl-diphosphatase